MGRAALFTCVILALASAGCATRARLHATTSAIRSSILDTHAEHILRNLVLVVQQREPVHFHYSSFTTELTTGLGSTPSFGYRHAGKKIVRLLTGLLSYDSGDSVVLTAVPWNDPFFAQASKQIYQAFGYREDKTPIYEVSDRRPEAEDVYVCIQGDDGRYYWIGQDTREQFLNLCVALAYYSEVPLEPAPPFRVRVVEASLRKPGELAGRRPAASTPVRANATSTSKNGTTAVCPGPRLAVFRLVVEPCDADQQSILVQGHSLGTVYLEEGGRSVVFELWPSVEEETSLPVRAVLYAAYWYQAEPGSSGESSASEGASSTVQEQEAGPGDGSPAAQRLKGAMTPSEVKAALENQPTMVVQPLVYTEELAPWPVPPLPEGLREIMLLRTAQ